MTAERDAEEALTQARKVAARGHLFTDLLIERERKRKSKKQQTPQSADEDDEGTSAADL